MINKIHDKAFCGDIDPILAYGQAKHLLTQYTKLVKELEELAAENLDNYEKEFDIDGYSFEKRNGRIMYDFKHIERWQELDKARKDLESDLKNALKMQGKIQMADADGLELELPKVSYTKDSLIVRKKWTEQII